MGMRVVPLHFECTMLFPLLPMHKIYRSQSGDIAVSLRLAVVFVTMPTLEDQLYDAQIALEAKDSEARDQKLALSIWLSKVNLVWDFAIAAFIAAIPTADIEVERADDPKQRGNQFFMRFKIAPKVQEGSEDRPCSYTSSINLHHS